MHLSHGQERTARVIKHVSGQGPIYIRALEDVFDDNVSASSMSLINGNCKNPMNFLYELQYWIYTFRMKRKVTVTMTNMKVFQEMSHSHCHQELVKVPGLILFKHDCKKRCWLFSSVS